MSLNGTEKSYVNLSFRYTTKRRTILYAVKISPLVQIVRDELRELGELPCPVVEKAYWTDGRLRFRWDTHLGSTTYAQILSWIERSKTPSSCDVLHNLEIEEVEFRFYIVEGRERRLVLMSSFETGAISGAPLISFAGERNFHAPSKAKALVQANKHSQKPPRDLASRAVKISRPPMKRQQSAKATLPRRLRAPPIQDSASLAAFSTPSAVLPIGVVGRVSLQGPSSSLSNRVNAEPTGSGAFGSGGEIQTFHRANEAASQQFDQARDAAQSQDTRPSTTPSVQATTIAEGHGFRTVATPAGEAALTRGDHIRNVAPSVIGPAGAQDAGLQRSAADDRTRGDLLRSHIRGLQLQWEVERDDLEAGVAAERTMRRQLQRTSDEALKAMEKELDEAKLQLLLREAAVLAERERALIAEQRAERFEALVTILKPQYDDLRDLRDTQHATRQAMENLVKERNERNAALERWSEVPRVAERVMESNADTGYADLAVADPLSGEQGTKRAADNAGRDVVEPQRYVRQRVDADHS